MECFSHAITWLIIVRYWIDIPFHMARASQIYMLLHLCISWIGWSVTSWHFCKHMEVSSGKPYPVQWYKHACYVLTINWIGALVVVTFQEKWGGWNVSTPWNGVSWVAEWCREFWVNSAQGSRTNLLISVKSSEKLINLLICLFNLVSVLGMVSQG